jgi:twitching motility protein PilT
MVMLSVKQNASDLHLSAGHSPMLRINGRLQPLALAQVNHQQLQQLSEQILDASALSLLAREGQVDSAWTAADGIRLRVNFFQQCRGLSVVMRIVAQHCPSLAQLHAPACLEQMLVQQEGLILVTGATGSGKSTTLAAMIGYLNQHQHRHIITLEDPIEIIHHSAGCLIQQRELGTHTSDFALAVRGALREDPDVLLLGELRDAASIALALTAAETGHLVLATLHTRNATQAIERIVDVFPAAEKSFVRSQLAGSLCAVVAQRLVLSCSGGRIALFEVLLPNSAVCNLIREGKTHQLADCLQTGAGQGMQTFAQSRQQRIDEGMLPAVEHNHTAGL